MSEPRRRNARACEKCRQSRKKCEPPYPCPSCRMSGDACVVRARPRPQRQRAATKKASKVSEPTNQVETFDSFAETGSTSSNISSITTDHVEICCTRKFAETALQDPLQRMKNLLKSCLNQNNYNGWDFKLDEPRIRTRRNPNSQLQLLTQDALGDDAQIDHFLTSLEKVLHKIGPSVIDIGALRDLAESKHPQRQIGIDLDSEFDNLETTGKENTDLLALFYICLAIGAHTTFNPVFHVYYSIAKRYANSNVTKPTYELCCFYFLQHHFVLRVGSCEQARAILARTIQAAHDLGLEYTREGVKGLQLYLYINVADQYSALTQGVPRVVHTSTLAENTFDRLLAAKPYFQNLVQIVLVNGQVIDGLYRSAPLSDSAVVLLESTIGRFCSGQTLYQSHPSDESTEFYQDVARIHMHYCRLSLRISMLEDPETWLASMTICCHAAQNIIRLTYRLYVGSHSVPKFFDQSLSNSNSEYTPLEPTHMPRTWRQIRRIVLAVFVIIYAYCHGELQRDDTLQLISKARVLLVYQRCKWGSALNEISQLFQGLYSFVGKVPYSGVSPADGSSSWSFITQAAHKGLTAQSEQSKLGQTSYFPDFPMSDNPTPNASIQREWQNLNTQDDNLQGVPMNWMQSLNDLPQFDQWDFSEIFWPDTLLAPGNFA